MLINHYNKNATSIAHMEINISQYLWISERFEANCNENYQTNQYLFNSLKEEKE